MKFYNIQDLFQNNIEGEKGGRRTNEIKLVQWLKWGGGCMAVQNTAYFYIY